MERLDRDAVERFVGTAAAGLRRGLKRDDVYHEVIRFAARNRLDRYMLWQSVITEAS